MEKEVERGKIERILDIYTRLNDGQVVNKQELADQYGVNARSIQRDMEDIRQYLDNQAASEGIRYRLIYDRQLKGFRLDFLETSGTMFTNDEILAVCKILLCSRAFPKKTMGRLLDKLVGACVPAINRKLVNNLISNERYHYIPPRHNKDVIGKLWTLGEAIDSHRFIDIKYQKLKGNALMKRRLEPVAVMFSEMYFYLTAFIIENGEEVDFTDGQYVSPTIYRIDRIQSLEVTDEHFRIPYRNRFEEGEFRKRIQFMTGGKLRKIKFRYTGMSIEAVLDRFPTAQVLEEKDGVYTVQAEVFGDGVDMWLRSQGDSVKVIA